MLGIPLEFYMNFDPPDIGTERFPMPFLLLSFAFDQSESLQCFDIGKYIFGIPPGNLSQFTDRRWLVPTNEPKEV
jgi:hypothetical protein